jgi:Fe-S-cluster containining protein
MTPDFLLLDTARDADLPAGEFTDWLTGMVRAIRDAQPSEVPCGDCNACCRSSYFIEVKPTDAQARHRIPAALLFDLPGAPAGHQLLGYDEAGRCPMLETSACSIYADRPLTCRTYDCRIFAATGIAEAAAEKADVTARARRWRFSYRDAESEQRHQSLRRGARLLLELRQQLREQNEAQLLPQNTTQLAMLAVQLHEQFHADRRLPDGHTDVQEKAALNRKVLQAISELMAAAPR